MKTIELREAQLLELEILRHIAQYCDDHGLTYWIAYGTLLGAVRHKGFIPWDDDVDILMPRRDYDKLIASFNGSGHPHFRLIAPGDTVSRHSFVKVVDTRTVKREHNFDYAPGDLGIDIDIFPLDGQPSDPEEFRRWYGKLKKYYAYADFFVRKRHDCRRKRLLLGLINALGGKRHLLGVAIKGHFQKKAAKLHKRYPYEGAEKVGLAEHFFGVGKERYDASMFASTVELEFEGFRFKAPADCDAVLRCSYGDYMQLPPEDQRQAHLIESAYWK